MTARLASFLLGSSQFWKVDVHVLVALWEYGRTLARESREQGRFNRLLEHRWALMRPFMQGFQGWTTGNTRGNGIATGKTVVCRNVRFHRGSSKNATQSPIFFSFLYHSLSLFCCELGILEVRHSSHSSYDWLPHSTRPLCQYQGLTDSWSLSACSDSFDILTAHWLGPPAALEQLF